jgi:hypothetical protein
VRRGVRYREASFLDRPRVAPDLRRHAVRLFVRDNAGRAQPGSVEAATTVSMRHGSRMDGVLRRVLAANAHARLIEIGPEDLGGLCLGSAGSADARFRQRALHLLSANNVGFCPEEANRAFPGWSQYDPARGGPKLNCSWLQAPRAPEAQPGCT